LYIDIPIAVIQMLFGIILLTFYDNYFLVLGFILILTLYGILVFTGKNGLESNYEESNAKYEVASWFQELSKNKFDSQNIENSTTIAEKTDNQVLHYLITRAKHFQTLLFQIRTLIVFKVLITAALLGYGTYLLVTQSLSVGQFVAVEIVIMMIIASVEKLIFSIKNVYEVHTSIEKLSTISDLGKSHNLNVTF
jgi:ABC-type bacteriocin/lantibiotic exporter with double-glycine peptidase domain